MIRARGRERDETPRTGRGGVEKSVDKIVDKCFQSEDKNDPVDNTAPFQENQPENQQIVNITTLRFPES